MSCLVNWQSIGQSGNLFEKLSGKLWKSQEKCVTLHSLIKYCERLPKFKFFKLLAFTKPSLDKSWRDLGFRAAAYHLTVARVSLLIIVAQPFQWAIAAKWASHRLLIRIRRSSRRELRSICHMLVNGSRTVSSHLFHGLTHGLASMTPMAWIQ